MFKKGLVIAAAVASSFVLAGCASQGTGGSACGEPTAVPVAAPAPMVNKCKSFNTCKQMVKKKHHRHHVKKAVESSATTTTTTTTSDVAATDATH